MYNDSDRQKKIQPTPFVRSIYLFRRKSFALVFRETKPESRRKKKSLRLHLLSINFDKSKHILCVPITYVKLHADTHKQFNYVSVSVFYPDINFKHINTTWNRICQWTPGRHTKTPIQTKRKKERTRESGACANSFSLHQFFCAT